MRHGWLDFGAVMTATALALAGCGAASDGGASGVGGGSGSSGGATMGDGTGSTGTARHANGLPGGADQGGSSKDTAGSAQPGAGGAKSGAGGAAGAVISAQCEARLLADPSTHVFFESADDSNSMGSPALARELLRAHEAPDPATVRTYEFLNYYRIRYAPPASGDVAVHLAAAIDPADPSSLSLQVGVRAYDAPAVRRPITLTFVLDTSGSMAGVGIERERAMLGAVAQKLRAGDVVSVLTWNIDHTVVLSGHRVVGPNDPAVLAAAAALVPAGGSDLHTGLVSAYGVARQYYGPDRVNRVVLVSDGGANLGVTDQGLIAEQAKDADQEGIYLAGVGTGPALGYNDSLMNQVTDAGRGAYVYLDSVEEAKRVFVDRFDEVMEIAARGVRLELDLPWYMSIPNFYSEAYSNDPNAIEPQHLAPSGEMVFNQVLRACDVSMIEPADGVFARVTWQAPFTHQAEKLELTTPISELLAGSTTALDKGRAIVAYAEALKLTGAAAKTALREAHAKITALLATKAFADDVELTEIAGLIPRHPAYSAP
jgi:Ca-activated chloride channel family protein